MSGNNISARSLKILKALVENYIKEGQPVGSKVLARDAQLMVSSATIRNIMADLESMGYLSSPHTSAGRVPTTQGYRLFIDHFITVQEPATQEMQQIKAQLGPDGDARALVVKASNLLSGITHLTGIVTMPRHSCMRLRHVEFLPLSDQRVLVVLVVNDHEVQNRVIQTNKVYSRSELERAGCLVTQQFQGQDLLSIRRQLVEELKKQRSDLDVMIKTVMDLAEETQRKENEQTFVVDGETNLFGQMDPGNVEGLKYLFDAFTQKNDLLHLLDQSIDARGIKIFVVEETGYDVLDKYSVVSAPYMSGNEVVGVLGVIGPRRMSYQKVITTVDITAKLLTSAFNIGSDD